MKKLRTLALAILASVQLGGTDAMAQDSQTITVAFDASGYSGDLAVEVDGIDMTGFAYLVEGGLAIEPDIPFAPGSYEVIVYLWNGSDYEIIASEVVEIDGTVSGAAEVSVSGVNEIGARTYNGDDTREFARSNGQFEFVGVNNRLKAGAAWVATTEADEELAGRPINLGEYYLEFSRAGERYDMTGRLGHQILSYDRALVSDLNRRGVSAHFSRVDQGLEFGAFAVQSADGIGVDNFLGLSESDDLVLGATLAFRPSASRDLQFGASVFSGRGVPFDGVTVSEGSGASLFLRGASDDQRMRYQFDLAVTEADEDAELAVFAPVTGTAILADVEYDLWQGDTGANLTLGFAYERVEADFVSLANPGFAAGREDYRLRFDYFNDSTTLGGFVEHKTTNIGGPSGDPTDRILTLQVDGTHLPYAEGGGPAWLGDPSLEFGTLITMQDRQETPPLAPAQEDFTEVSVYGGLNVQHENWGWSGTYTFTNFDDRSAFNEDESAHELRGMVDWTDNERWDISASATAIWIDDFVGTYVDRELNLSASYDFVPGRWNGALALNYYDYGAPGSEDGLSIGADVTWNFAPSAEMVFSGGYASGSSATETSDDPEWFVGLMLRQSFDTMRGGY